MLYKAKTVLNGNPCDLSEKNLAYTEPMEIDMEMRPGYKIGVNGSWNDIPTTRIIYLVLAVWHAKNADESDTLILFEIGREDIAPSETVVEIESSVSINTNF